MILVHMCASEHTHTHTHTHTHAHTPILKVLVVDEKGNTVAQRPRAGVHEDVVNPSLSPNSSRGGSPSSPRPLSRTDFLKSRTPSPGGVAMRTTAGKGNDGHMDRLDTGKSL